MDRRSVSPPPGLSRRAFLALGGAAVGLCFPRARAGTPGGDVLGEPAPPSPFERAHLPVLHVPRVTANGAKVPVRVALDHPMTSDHHVESIEVVNERDPFPSKGTFRLTPANGRAEVAFQIRLSAGTSRVDAIARCSRHGTFSTSRVVEIPDGAGGCTGTAPATTPAAGDLVRPPVIRIAELVERGRIRRGEIVHVQLKMRHPSRTGLGLLDGDFVQASEPFHLVSMEVAYGGERVCTFEMTPALSDDPFVTFALLARRDAPLEVSLVNSRGERFEARHDIRLS